MLRLIAWGFFCFSTAALAGAQPATLFEHDPVALADGRAVRGSPFLTHTFGGYTYRFVDERTRSVFMDDPGAYAVALGGSCARLGPLAQRGDPEIFARHDGRLYLFSSRAHKTEFVRAPGRFLWEHVPRLTGTQAEADLARDALDRAAEAIGDIDALTGLRLVEVRAQAGADDRRTTKTWQYPDRYAREVQQGQWRWSVAVAGSVGVLRRAEKRAMVPAQVEALWRRSMQEPLAVLRARQNQEFFCYSQGMAGLDGAPMHVVETWYKGWACTLWIDQETGRVRAMETRARGPDGSLGELRLKFKEFEAFEGMMLPTLLEYTFEGTRLHDRDVRRVVVRPDPHVPAGLFDVPGVGDG